VRSNYPQARASDGRALDLFGPRGPHIPRQTSCASVARLRRQNCPQQFSSNPTPFEKITLTNLVTVNDPLQLSETLEVDAATLNILSFQGNYQAVLTLPGDLLSYQYDDLPAFSDWLLLEREKLSQLRSEALVNLTKQAESDDDFSAALTYAATLLQLDPMNEETYRVLMRLHYLSGNRSEALKLFEKCKTVLRTELGVEPLSETQRLAAAMSAGQLETPVPNAHKTSVPLSVLRPPVLVGREHDWRQLEAAWQGGKIIFLGGEPGVGKTRLIQAFTEDKGVHHFFASRPGDESVSLSSLARAMRQLLENHDLSLEPWILAELSRLIPHLSKTTPAPIIAESDKLRFCEAVAETLERTVTASTGGVIWDDLQYFDAASFEVWHYLVNRFTAQETSLRFINIFRNGELSFHLLAAAKQMVAHDRGVYLEQPKLHF
jgi:hypothetical protein